MCTLEPWLPARHDPSTILVVGGSHQGRLDIASDLARAMDHTQTIILATSRGLLDNNALNRFDNVTVADAVWVDPAPDSLPVVVVDESFPGDARLLPSVWSARRRRCRTIVMSSNSRLRDETRFDIVIGNCDRDTVGALMNQCRRPVPPNLIRSCARRGSAFGASVSIAISLGDVIGTYTSGDKAALAQCDACAVSRPHGYEPLAVVEPFPPRKIRPGQSASPVGGDSCASCMETLEYVVTDDVRSLQCPLCGWAAVFG